MIGALVAACAVFGVAIPAIVLAASHHTDKGGPVHVQLSSSEEHGRELFSVTCNQCHTLRAANAVGQVGPNFDQLQPPKALVIDAIANGRARGAGRMPAGLLSGKDAADVAAYVDKVAGR